MNIAGRVWIPVAVCATAVLAAPAPVLAQAKPVGWTITANVSTVATAGNTQAFSLGGKARAERNWLRTVFFLEGSATRQDASDRTVLGVGTPPPADSVTGTPGLCESSCQVSDTSMRNKKAENYTAETGVERKVTERFFYTVNGGYKRDLFSGIETLASGRAGVGYFWSDRRAQDLKLSIDATITHEKERVPDPKKKENFVGARLQGDYAVKFGDTKQSQFTSKLALDENFQVTSDWRLLSDNALTVVMTRRLSLQVGAKIDFRNMPALQEIEVYGQQPPIPVPQGVQSLGKATTPLQKTDGTLTISLVVNWGPQGPSGARPTP